MIMMTKFYHNHDDTSHLNIIIMIFITAKIIAFPFGQGCRIHWLHLCRGVRPLPPTTMSLLDMAKPFDSEAPVLELWEMWSTP